MHIACLDMEGVLVPEVWINVAERTGIEELRLTTRDIADYDELMTHRIKVLKEKGLKLSTITEVIADMGAFEGACEFVDWLRARWQVVILSDTFYDFANPLMDQLHRPTLFCHNLVIENDEIVGYKLRQQNQKYHAVKAFQSLGFTTLSTGDSYNDTAMLNQAEFGALFNPPANVIEEFPHLPVAHTYEDLKTLFSEAVEKIDAGVSAK